MKKDLNNKWEKLIKGSRAASRAQQLLVAQFNNKKREIYFSYNSAKNIKSLLIQLEEKLIVPHKLPQVNGLSYKKTFMKTGNLFALEIFTDEIYFDLAQDCLNKILEMIKPSFSDENAVNSISDFLSRNKHYFASKSFDVKKLAGLYGELYFMKNFILEKGKKNDLLYWLGPDKNKFDFEIPDNFIEVKMKSHNKTHVEISSENQLDASRCGTSNLYLTVFSYNRVNSEQNSILEIIAQIRNAIKTKPQLLEHFNNGIETMGINDKNIKTFNHYFEITEEKIYHITTKFPRLIRSNIPFSEISDVSYSISISGLSKFTVPVSKLFK